MKALITGAGGQLGSDLSMALPDAVAFTRRQLSVLDADAVREAIADARPDVVFNCAAYNAVDRAETEPAAAAVNAEGPALLAKLCLESNCRLVHFSTNFVFDGESPEPYTERDEPRPLSVYARSKLEGETRVLEAMPSALVIRSAGLFGARGSAIKGGSFPERILQRARHGAPLTVVDDQRLNPTFTQHLARAAIELAEGGLEGVVHVVADGCCSWFDFAMAALDIARVPAQISPISTTELRAVARRPANGCLRSVRTAALPPWREGVEEWFRAYSAASGPR